MLFTGTVHLPGGEHYVWQQGAPVKALLDGSWGDRAAGLDALGHPVRLALVRQVLLGRRTTAELADLEEMGTTGQLHHHLRQLVAAGWLRSTGRGRYEVPPERVVALCTIMLAVAP